MVLQKVIDPRFDALKEEMMGIINSKQTGGSSILVCHSGKIVYCNTYGWQDIKAKRSIELDTIFRIYSMTKPVVCLAAMILYEEGKFSLNDSLEKFIPEFSNMSIINSYDIDTRSAELVSATKKITIRQLFTHTSGITYGFDNSQPADQYFHHYYNIDSDLSDEVSTGYSALEFQHNAPPLREFIPTLAGVPLLFEPGEHFWYGLNHDVIGYLIEVISGQPLDKFLKERIFDPLGMVDTGFYTPPEKWNRMAMIYTHENKKPLHEYTSIMKDHFRSNPTYLSGGGGLVSTLEDYYKFCRMMLEGGELDGKRIISPETISLMIKNHFPDGKMWHEMAFVPDTNPETISNDEGMGHGLGIQVKVSDNKHKCRIGTHRWGGALKTGYWIDPKEGVIVIYMTQYAATNDEDPVDRNRIDPLIYQALQLD